MRHFAHHIGDYAAATAHLSMLEDAAYHRLLRLYYQNEAPLTQDENELMRRLRAHSRHEKDAVRRVLTEFFTLSSDGWHQSRADVEISNFKHLVEAGRKGGLKSRPPKASGKTELTTTHNPLPTTHEPIEESERASRSGSRLPDDWQPSKEDRFFAGQYDIDVEATAAVFRDYWHGVAGAKGRKANWPGTWRNWVRREVQSRQKRINGGPSAPSVALPVDRDSIEQWRTRLRGWQPGKPWLYEGAPPGEPGCRVPQPLLAELEAA